MERTGGRQYAPGIVERKTQWPVGCEKRTGRYAGPARRDCRRLYVRSPNVSVSGRKHADRREYLQIEGRQGEQIQAGMASGETALAPRCLTPSLTRSVSPLVRTVRDRCGRLLTWL